VNFYFRHFFSQAHGIPLLNATAIKKEIAKEVKGPYGESDIIGGMMPDGY
jgi:hypothetical protein